VPENIVGELLFPGAIIKITFRGFSMLTAIDRVMQTYGMIVKMTAEEKQAAREKLSGGKAGSQRK
jgi:hypothetical protein